MMAPFAALADRRTANSCAASPNERASVYLTDAPTAGKKASLARQFPVTRNGSRSGGGAVMATGQFWLCSGTLPFVRIRMCILS